MLHIPRLDQNLRSAPKNAFVLQSPTNSKCTAFVTKHIKTQMYNLIIGAFLRRLVFVKIGPMKSTPHTLNARSGSIRVRGKSPTIGAYVTGFERNQITHRCAMLRPFKGQNCSRIEANSACGLARVVNVHVRNETTFL